MKMQARLCFPQEQSQASHASQPHWHREGTDPVCPSTDAINELRVLIAEHGRRPYAPRRLVRIDGYRPDLGGRDLVLIRTAEARDHGPRIGVHEGPTGLVTLNEAAQLACRPRTLVALDADPLAWFRNSSRFTRYPRPRNAEAVALLHERLRGCVPTLARV